MRISRRVRVGAICVVLSHVSSGVMLCWFYGHAPNKRVATSVVILHRVVFRISYFAGMQILVVFVILGIGADDCFVFVDAWKQSLLYMMIHIRGCSTPMLEPYSRWRTRP